MLHEKSGKRGTQNRDQYQVAQSWFIAKMDGACSPEFEVWISNLEFSHNEVWVGVAKIPAKIFIFEEILKITFQLSIEHSIFHLEFMSVCVAALLLFKPCSSYYSGFGIFLGQKAYAFQLLPYKNEKS